MESSIYPGVQIGDVRRICDWCSALNLVKRGGAYITPAWCGGCGHRGDVVRARCNCPRCLGQRASVAS